MSANSFNIAIMRKALLLGGFILAMLSADAQYYDDWGFQLGVATHRGDVSKSKGSNPTKGSKPNISFGGYYRHSFSNLLSGKVSLQWGRISGADSDAEDPERVARNLSFRTDLFELAGIVEVHFINIRDFGRTGRYKVWFNTYVFTGFALTYFNPKAQRDNGEWVNLAPLQTEGEKYSQITPAIPLGIGAHFTFNRKWRLGAELGYRFTFTDYLDDVHDRYMTDEQLATINDEVRLEMQNRSDQDFIDANPQIFGEGYRMGDGGIRGGPDVNDAYFFGTVNVGFMIRGKSNFYRAKYMYTKGRRHKKRKSRAKF